MTMERITDDDFEEIIMPDGSRSQVLKDRHTMRVPMRMADSASRILLHRPGFAVADGASREAKQSVYDAYDAELAGAYLNTPTTGPGSREYVGQRAGDICTIDGKAGHLRFGPDGKLTCVPDQQRDHKMADAREEAYLAYEAELTNAWR
jgi:hypothetical protein